MNLTPGLVTITTDGTIGRAGVPVRVFHVQLSSGTQNSTVYLRHGSTVSDSIVFTLEGTNSKTVDLPINGGMYFERGCFADVDTAVSYVSIVYSEEK